MLDSFKISSYIWWIMNVLIAYSCLTLWTIAHQTPPVRGILQARILEWVAIPFSRRSSWPKDWTWVSCIGTWILRGPLILLWYTHISTNCSLNTSGLLSSFSTEKQVATEKNKIPKRNLESNVISIYILCESRFLKHWNTRMKKRSYLQSECGKTFPHFFPIFWHSDTQCHFAC